MRSSRPRARSARWSTTPATASPARSRPCRWRASGASSRPTSSGWCGCASSSCRGCARQAAAGSSTSARSAAASPSPAAAPTTDQARGRGALRRAALRGRGLRHRCDRDRAGPDHDRVRERRGQFDGRRSHDGPLRRVQHRGRPQTTASAYESGAGAARRRPGDRGAQDRARDHRAAPAHPLLVTPSAKIDARRQGADDRPHVGPLRRHPVPPARLGGSPARPGRSSGLPRRPRAPLPDSPNTHLNIYVVVAN